jgi:pimeloyl-ACP methyl ester carboxylesterase
MRLPGRLAGGVAALLVLMAGCTSDTPTVARSSGPSPATAGAPLPPVSLKACPGLRRVRCGTIRVPRYWSQGVDPATDMKVAFRVYEHTDRSAPAREPLVAFEGGPGYPSIGSASSYLAMMGPLHRDHDLIVMDQRGTGASGAIDCPALQRGVGEFVDLVAACARTLGDTANAYGSAAASDDLHAILVGLGVPEVDLYGDSYGTYLAQVFALLHPDQVRAVVLDGAYDQSFDLFARDAAAAIRRAWRALCARDGTCPHVLETIGRYARTLAAHPLTGMVHGRRVRLTDEGLAQMVYDGAYVFTIYRDLPAAIRAAERGDTVPLLRLVSEDLSETGNGSDVRAYSQGLYMAVSCHDYPTIWDPAADPAERRAQLDEAIDRLAPDAFAPFSRDTWLHSLYEYELVYGCLKWPRPAIPDPPFPADAVRSEVPMLVLNGELDITTPLSDARAAADAWPDATLVEVRNEVHISALYDMEDCASVIARRFIRTLDPGDVSCASRIPDVEVVPTFPPRVAAAPAADAAPGDRSAILDRRAAWVATQSIGDAFTRWYNLLFGGTGRGLRGGSYTMRGPYLSHRPLTITLRGTELVPDLAISGPAVWDRTADRITARLRIDGAVTGHLTIRFATRTLGADAAIHGTLDGRRVHATVPAPWAAP